MAKIKLYFHAGAGNHGCEAIVRSTYKILGGPIDLFSFSPEEDIRYGLDKIATIYNDAEIRLKKKSLAYIHAAIAHRIRKDDYIYYIYSHKNFFDMVKKGDICLSIGGDNYCYAWTDILGYYNKKIHSKGAKSVLWGCSIEPSDITEEIAEDLRLYDLVIAREPISYNMLKDINSNTVLLPDPAFQLDYENNISLFNDGGEQFVGINISPLISEYGNGKLIFENYRELIQWILDNTQYSIMLLPHVVKEKNDDRVAQNDLFRLFRNNDRVVEIEDGDCTLLKSYISKCKFFVAARTHASIAAYSTFVPTLVTGYSTKAIGIAKSIFGTSDHFVVPVQSFKSPMDLTTEFQWLLENQQDVRENLNRIIPDYKKEILKARELIKNMI